MTPNLLPANWAAKITVTESGCWQWTGARNSNGYGIACIGDGRTALAHRATYTAMVAPIADGLQIDHLCRNRDCCNPAHLEPVTAAVNQQRAKALITHCPQGHAYDGANTFYKSGARQCRECTRAYKRRWDHRQRAKHRADVEALAATRQGAGA